MKKSVVTDQIKKTKTITHYDYDAFGRRTLVQDEGGKIIRTLYDGLSFDIIREQETFADGYFTNTSDTGIAWSPVSEGDGSRYRYIGDDAPAAKEQNGYSVTASNRASSRVALYANGQAVGVTRSSNYASSERSYFGTDLMGTVRSATTDSGSAEYYEYDVFGKPYGESVSDYAYTGKPYDPVTGMYNYGYRDYVPQTARFSTVDPIRDGNNWFAYCNNEPVNFRDLWGLESWAGINPALKKTVEEYKAANPPHPSGTWILVEDGGFGADYSEVEGSTVNKHLGEDYIYVDEKGNNITKGAPVQATSPGKVIDVDENDVLGKYVRIEREDGGRDDYFHLDSQIVKEDDVIKEGDVLGKAGDTGVGNAHLHKATSYPQDKVPDNPGETIDYGGRVYVNPKNMK